METSSAQVLFDSVDNGERILHSGLVVTVEERLRSLDPASADPINAAEVLGALAGVLQNACGGNVAEEYADNMQAAMQDCIRLAGTAVTWMAQGGAAAVASSSPANCSSLKDFVSAALELASYAFFSPEWYERLGPGRYVQAGNAVRGYMRDLAPAALDATEACWRAVEQQLGCGDPGGEELLEACKALFGALFEGLRHLGTTSAERINDPGVPREMRSFAGLNILWTGLSRIMTALSADALHQLLSGSAVQSVLRSLLGYLAAEVRSLVACQPGDYETRLKVSRFWLQHAARVAQAHTAAAGACWDALAATAAEVYGHIAGCAAAAVAVPGAVNPEAATQGHNQQQQQLQAQKARDLDAAVACKLTSVLAVVLDAGDLAGGGRGGGGAEGAQEGAALQQGGASVATPQQLEARLAKLEAMMQHASKAEAATANPEAAGAVLLSLALLQRAAHVSPDARAAMVARLLPPAGLATATALYGMALDPRGLASVSPCLELPHQLAAAALALLAACAEQQAGGQDLDSFAAGCAALCNWGACAHPVLSSAAADVLSTLVQHCEPSLAKRLMSAVARMAGLAAAAEAVTTAAPGAGALVGNGATGNGGGENIVGQAWGVAKRLELLLASMLEASMSQSDPAWREVLAELLPPHADDSFRQPPSQPEASLPVGLDTCGAATARVLWGAAAAAAGAHAMAAGAGHVAPSGPVVSDQELCARLRALLGAARQAAAILSGCTVEGDQGGAFTGRGDGLGASTCAALCCQWLAQLLGCMEATLSYARQGGGAALQQLAQEAAGLAAELLQVLLPEPSPGSALAPIGAAAASSAAARLLSRIADCLQPAALAAVAPALTRLAEQAGPVAAADIAAVAAYCNSPPPEALFHTLLRSPHPTVLHAALQSQVQICRTVPQQYAASVRRLFPPDAAAAAAAGPAPPANLALVFKSYMARRVGHEEAAAVASLEAAAGQALAAEGARLAGAARAGCAADPAMGRPVAPASLRQAVHQGIESLQASMHTLSLAQSEADGGYGDGDPMVTDDPHRSAQHTHSHTQHPQQQQQQQQGGPGAGPLSSFVSEDNAAICGLNAALGGLERCLGALRNAVLSHGISAGRSAEWDQLQAHARQLLGDLSSATSRIRNMNELLYALQGR